MKNSSWLLIVIIIVGASLYRERDHLEEEGRLRTDAKELRDLARFAKDKYQRLKTFATIESIEQAEGAASAAEEQGFRMAIEKTGPSK